MAEEEKPATTRTAVDYDGLADQLRARLDLFGKSIAGIATLGTGAVGLATVSDLSPRGLNSGLVAVLAILGLFVAAWGAVRVALGLIQVNRPVVLEADDRVLGLTGVEKTDVERIFRETAGHFGLSSLVGLQDREGALRQAAARADTAEERARRTTLADESLAAIQQALARARWALVRRRASDAAAGTRAFVSYLMVAAGLLGFAFLSDVATANQDDNIATAKACAEARKAGALKRDLRNTTCARTTKKAAEDPAAPVSGDQARAAVLAELTKSLKTCYDLVPSGPDADPTKPLAASECDALEVAIKAVLGG